MRHTSSHTKNRRSHHALTATKVVTDKESGNLRLPHRLDEKTGMYRGKLIVPERKKELKEDKKRKQSRETEDAALGAKDLPTGQAGPVKEEKHTVVEEREKKQGLMGRMTLGKAKSRSGFGGGV
jgi:large subunit ribosomal protein L32